jgi:WD40 repeat protein
MIRNHFKAEEPDWISTKPVVEADWNACLQTLEGHSHLVNSVAFSHDCQRLASGSSDDTIKIWDTASGRCIQTLEGHSHWVQSVIFLHDGQRLASGSNNNTIKIWDATSGRCVQTFNVGTSINHISFDRTNGYIFTDIGYIKIATATVEDPTEPHDTESQSYSFGQDRSWITCNDQNVLWLPSEYRPGCVAFKGRMISIGCLSGRVFIIGFSRDV